jgi:dihydropteroate synthase
MRNFIPLILNMNPSSTISVPPKITLRNKDRMLILDKPIVMGILNIAPDSFYDGGKYQAISNALNRVEQIISEGATIVDIGAFSSRPGSRMITVQEELNRLDPLLVEIDRRFPGIYISIDTYRADVARSILNEHNIFMINDISGGNWSTGMFELISELKVPYILMHSKGMPDIMQVNPSYEKLLPEMFGYFVERIGRLNSLGVFDLVIDPGFGFGKSLEHNFEILSALSDFTIFGLPVLVGLSRKSMVQKALGVKSITALNGTTALNTIALMKGSKILRVHDVKEAIECIRLVNLMHSS